MLEIGEALGPGLLTAQNWTEVFDTSLLALGEGINKAVDSLKDRPEWGRLKNLAKNAEGRFEQVRGIINNVFPEVRLKPMFPSAKKGVTRLAIDVPRSKPLILDLPLDSWGAFFTDPDSQTENRRRTRAHVVFARLTPDAEKMIAEHLRDLRLEYGDGILANIKPGLGDKSYWWEKRLLVGVEVIKEKSDEELSRLASVQLWKTVFPIKDEPVIVLTNDLLTRAFIDGSNKSWQKEVDYFRPPTSLRSTSAIGELERMGRNFAYSLESRRDFRRRLMGPR